MSDLTDFLLARIGDEEELATDAASEGTPSRTGWQLWTSKVDTTPGGERLGPRGSVEASPARILAECEAKRRIVELHRPIDAEVQNCITCEHPEDELASGEPWPCETIRALALPYADHPDYREYPRWRRV